MYAILILHNFFVEPDQVTEVQSQQFCDELTGIIALILEWIVRNYGKSLLLYYATSLMYVLLYMQTKSLESTFLAIYIVDMKL